MADDRDALIEHYRQTRAELLSAIEGLRDEQMTEPSIDGWSVKDHLAHITLWDEIRAHEVERISAGYEAAWRMRGEQDGVYSELGYTLRHDLSLDQVKWELATSRQSLLDAIAATTPRGLDGSRYGEAGLWSNHERQHAGWIKRWREEKGY
jgi:uncharacterized damage-inducible protein DinB